MRGREIVLLVLIVVAGLVLYSVRTGKDILVIEGDNEFFKIGVKAFIYEDSQVIAPPLPERIEIDHSYGDVEVLSADQENIRLLLRKRIWRKKKELADEVAMKLKIVTSRSGERLGFSVNREDFTKRNFETDFVLVIPRNKDVVIRNSYGAIRMEDVRNGSVSNSHGRVVVAGVQGELSVDNSYEDIHVEDIGASLRLTGRHADLRVRSVAGPAHIDHSFGKIDIDDLQGDLVILGNHSEIYGRKLKGRTEIKTSYEKLVLSDIGPAALKGPYTAIIVSRAAGDLIISNTSNAIKLNDISGSIIVEGENSDITGRQISGPEIHISSSYEDIKLFGFSGATTIHLSHGDAVLEPASPEFPIAVENSYSHIRFFWPKGERGPLEARSHGGDVVWNIAETPSKRSANGDVIVTAGSTNGNVTPAVRLTTSYGDITVTDETLPPKKR